MTTKVSPPKLPKRVNINALSAAQVREIAGQIEKAAACGQSVQNKRGEG